MGHVCPNYSFSFPLWLVCPSPRPHRKTSVSVGLPSPTGRGGDFCSLRSRGSMEGRFCRDKGAKKYPTLLTTCLSKNPLLHIRSILAEVRNQIFFPYFSHTELIYSSMWQFKGKIIISLLFNFSYNYIFFS